MTGETPLISVAEYARRRGVCEGTVRYAMNTGRIPFEVDASNNRRLIDPTAADRAWDKNSDKSKQAGPAAQLAAAPAVVIRRPDGTLSAPERPAPKPRAPLPPSFDDGDNGDDDESIDGIPGYMVSKAKREHYQAALAELAYEEKAGRLVSAEDVKREAFAVARTVREAILNIPERIAAELAGESDVDRVYQMLVRELTQALASLAGEGT